MLVETEEYNYQVNFKHYYLPQLRTQKDGSLKYELHPKATKCVIKYSRLDKQPLYDIDGLYERLIEGYSVCSDNDQFSKDVGRFQSLINCLKQINFTRRKEFIVQYLLEYRYSKLEKIVLSELNLHLVDYNYISLKKDKIKEIDFYDNSICFGNFRYTKEDFPEYLTEDYLVFDKSKDDPKQFVRSCILQLINNKYKHYYS